MIGLWWFICSSAAAPDRVAESMEVGAQVVDVVAASNRSTVALLNGAGDVTVLDLATWDTMAVVPCSGVGGIAADPVEAGRFWAGCEDGSVQWFAWDDGKLETGTTTISMAEKPIVGLASSNTLLFAVANNPAGGNPQVHAYSFESERVLTDGFPSTLSYGSVEDIDANASFAFLSHGGASFSKVTSGGGASRQQSAPSAAKTSDVETIGSTRVFVAGGGSGVLEFQTGSNILSLFLTEDGGVESASAILANETDEWFAVADDESSQVIFVELDTAAGFPTSRRIATVDLDGEADSVREMAHVDGYVIAGTDEGSLLVLTDRPWVEATAASPAAALSGDTVSVPFTSDQSGTWEIRLNADSNEAGERVAEGTVIAGEPTEATFEVDDSFREGQNTVRIVVENEGGKRGHDSTSVNVDNPPTKVTLSQDDVGFGDGRIEVRLRGISDEDLSHYVVYVSSVEFTAEEYSSGGPTLHGDGGESGDGGQSLPMRVSMDPGKNKTISVDSLTNGTTYYLAIRAYDQSGQESLMSNVVSETPRETFGASDLVGEQGGYGCNAAGPGSSGMLALFGGLIAAASRRRVFAATLLGAGLFAQPAMAETDSEWPQKGTEFSDFVGRTFEARYGGQTFDEPVMDQVFGDSHRIFWMEYGMTLFELTEFTVATGLYKDPGHKVDSTGAQSADDDTLQAIPFNIDATFRLDVLPEQPIVPFVGYGLDYWLWEESWSGGEESGGKSGSHTSLGVNILLDIFQPERASRLEASSGITDSYISIEWRKQTIGDGAGLSFSGEAVMVGLKLDH